MGLIDGRYLYGRWAITILNLIKGGAVVPVFNTAISIILMGFTSVLLTKLLSIRKKGMIVLISLLLSTTPTFATTLIYTYCSDAYSLAMFLSVLLVYFIYKKKALIYLIGSSICVALVMGLYQAYLGVFTGLCVIMPIIEILKNDRSIKEIWKNIFKSIVVILVGALMYYCMTSIVLKILDMSLASYGGANKIGLSIFKNLPQAITQAYKSFYQFFFTNNIFRNSYWNRQYINLIIFIVIALNSIILIVKNKSYKPVRLITFIICITIFPIALTLIRVIAQERDINLLMGAPFYLVYILLIVLLEMLEFSWKEIAIKWISLIVLTIMIFGYIITIQCTYLARKVTYDQTYSHTTRILERIELQEDYYKGMPICFVGSINVPTTPILKTLRVMSTGANSEIPEVDGSYQNGKTTMKVFIDKYCGVEINWCTKQQYNEITNSNEFKEMSVYPKENSIKVINNVMVIKLSEKIPK